MERKKHKRLNDTIMKPEDMKKAKLNHKLPTTSGGTGGPSTSGGVKAKLDFRSKTCIPPKPTLSNSANPSLQSSHLVRPNLDDQWKDFGDTINLNIETFQKSVQEAILAGHFTKIAKMFVAALKSFFVGEKLKVELRIMGTIAETVKNHGDKLNQIPLHRALLFVICNSRSYPDNILELFISIITSLARQQPILDKCYLTAFLHDSIGMSVGLGTMNRCSWIEKECSAELVKMILDPFETVYPFPAMYAQCQVENFAISEFLSFFSEKVGKSREKSPRSNLHQKQLDVFLEFLKPWFDTIRGEVLPKPLFRALCLLCGYEHIRLFIANRLEIWITLQKFHREISELLLVIGSNINAENHELDKEIIDILLKLNTKNMKTRTVVGPFTQAIKTICEVSRNVEIVLDSLFINETGPAQNRSPTNLQTIYMILQNQPTEATKALAVIISKELFKEKENCVKMLRAFMRELIRGFYHSKSGDFPFSVFAETLFNKVQRRGEPDEILSYAVDLIAQLPLATISSLLTTRENAFSIKFSVPTGTGDVPLIPVEARLARQKFECEFISYCEKVIEQLLKSRNLFFDEQVFIRSFSILLYLETQRDVYTGIEMAAVTDSEISNCIRIFGECGVSENMLLMICREETTQLPQKSQIDLISALTQRAALFHPKITTNPLIRITEPFKLIDSYLKMTIFPRKEAPRLDPPICNRKFYWTAWTTIILWIAAGTEIISFFEEIYSEYPILRYLIHCILCQKFEFPLEFEGKSVAMMNDEEAVAVDVETRVIEMYEKNMKRAVPAMSMEFPNRNSFRAPPLLDDIHLFADKFKLASRFSRCTSPPLLSRLISNVGSENSLFAVREMLSSDSTTAKILTAECIFHALMYYFDNQRIRDSDQNSTVVVKALIRQAEVNLKSIEPIEQDFLLHSFISSLASSNISTRSAAVNTCSRLFPSSEEDKAFDLVKLSNVPRFNARKLKYMEIIASAVLVESDSHLSNSYLQFLTINSMNTSDDHTVAHAICQTLSIDCIQLHTSLCEYFLQYVDTCLKNHQIKNITSLDTSLTCIEFGNQKIALSNEVPSAIVKLLSKYDNLQTAEKGISDPSFEGLLELFLSPNAIPNIIDRETGASNQFLSLQMRKEMLKSVEQRVVDAALIGLSEHDAQEFILVSRMSKETAEKVIKMAENMPLDRIDHQSLSNMYLLIRGYRMIGVQSGETLINRIKSQMDNLDAFIAKEEPMEIVEVNTNDMPTEFLIESMRIAESSSFSNQKEEKMDPNVIATWLKTNCSLAASTKNKETSIFSLPAAFIQSAMNDETSSIACLAHIEANLKFFLSFETAFQTLIVIIDSAANKFNFVRNRLENLATRLLKSVTPPESVAGILQKHAANSIKSVQKSIKPTPIKISTFAEFSKSIKNLKSSANSSEIKEKRLVDEFMIQFVEDKGEVIDSDDILIFIASIQSVYSGENAEITAERCLSNRWSAQLRKVVSSTILEKYYTQLCSIFVFRLISAYCKKYPLASYSEMFTLREPGNKEEFVLNRRAFDNCILYFCDVAADSHEYDLQIINLIAGLESQGGTDTGFYFGRALLETACANPKSVTRITAKRLLELLRDRLPYLSYRNGISSSIRVLTNVESRESCIRRCEQIVDRIVEMPIDLKMALSEDICEEERIKKDRIREKSEEAAENSKFGGKRSAGDRRGGGPPPKKGRFISAKDLPVPLGQQNDEDSINAEDVPVKREWIDTSHAMTRFVSLLREHPNFLKMKFPVLANYVSRVNAMNRKELAEENRVGKIELILQSVIVLCPHMAPDEMSSVDTALSNCLEFYEKHIDEGGFGIKEQTAFAELTIRACAEYLNHSFVEARSFLRDNRQLIDRVCKRCHDRYNVDLVLDNCGFGEPSL